MKKSTHFLVNYLKNYPGQGSGYPLVIQVSLTIDVYICEINFKIVKNIEAHECFLSSISMLNPILTTRQCFDHLWFQATSSIVNDAARPRY